MPSESLDTQEREYSHSDLIVPLQEFYKRWKAMWKVEQKLDLALKAFQRSAAAERLRKEGKELPKGTDAKITKDDKSIVLGLYPGTFEALEAVQRDKSHHEKNAEFLVKKLPVYERATERGINLKLILAVVGECGDLHNYANPAKVWKRLGLAVNADGKAQKNKKGEPGYAPMTRSAVYAATIAACNMRQGPYGQIMKQRKEYEVERNERDALGLTAMHLEFRAHRYVEKRMARDLWCLWNGKEIRSLETQ